MRILYLTPIVGALTFAIYHLAFAQTASPPIRTNCSASEQAFGVCSLPLQSKTQANDLGLCQVDEIPIFTCETNHKKIISFCGSSAKVSKPYLDYRYGKKGKVEMTYQVSDDYPDHKISLVTAIESNADRPFYYIYFQNDDYGYYFFLAAPNKTYSGQLFVGEALFEGVREPGVKPKPGIDCQNEFSADKITKALTPPPPHADSQFR